MEIPVANIYYLLAYAWDKLAEQRIVLRNADDCKTPLDLLAKILANGTTHLFKKGLDRNYREQEDSLAGIKGKLLLAESLKQQTFQRGKAVCRFDEFNHDVLHNQILKATLGRLQNLKILDEKIRREVRLLFNRFHEVSDISLSKPVFRRVQLHRNNQFYGFLLHVCELLNNNLLPDEEPGQFRFRDFLKDEKQMPGLFEAFVRNFFKKELDRAKWVSVRREDIKWQFIQNDHVLLPKMQTDVCLRTADRKIIVETKFSKNILTGHRGGAEKLSREHLSQIFSYLKNQKPDDLLAPKAKGILLYASTVISISADFEDEKGHRIAVRTVDLSADWQHIAEQLKRIVETTEISETQQ